MKTSRFNLMLVAVVIAAIGTQTFAGTGQVTRSGSTFTAKVDGSVVYTGDRYFDAINAACSGAGTYGTVNILNSGSSGEDGGSVYAIKPLAGQTLNFNGCTVNCNSSGDLIVAVYADRKDDITVNDIIVTGNPRYAFWFRGCNNMTFTDITMNLDDDSPVGLGIRVDASTASSSNLTINGTINIDGSAGHAIETYSVDGVEIGDVTVTNTGGCGVLLNDSEDCNVGVVTGHYNCPDAGYATFRVANGNGTTYCAGVYSRNSGRGFFSVTESSNCTVEWVDISDTYSQCIYIQDSYNTHVLHGTTSNCGADSYLINGGSGNSVNLDGETGGSSTNNGTVNGTYAIIAKHSSKALDVYAWGTSNGTNIDQWSYWGGTCQQFVITPVDDEWHSIVPVIATDKALDVYGISTENGANINIWDYWGGYGQQFRFQSAGTGYWRIINRNSEKCLDIENASTDDGANVIQWECTSGSEWQMFSLTKISSKKQTEIDNTTTSETFIYPNPAKNQLNVVLPGSLSNANLEIYDQAGRLIYTQTITKNNNPVNISSLASGVYFIKVTGLNMSFTSKLLKE